MLHYLYTRMLYRSAGCLVLLVLASQSPLLQSGTQPVALVGRAGVYIAVVFWQLRARACRCVCSRKRNYIFARYRCYLVCVDHKRAEIIPHGSVSGHVGWRKGKWK